MNRTTLTQNLIAAQDARAAAEWPRGPVADQNRTTTAAAVTRVEKAIIEHEAAIDQIRDRIQATTDDAEIAELIARLAAMEA